MRFSPNNADHAKPPLVIFAPFPPAKNGIADYVAELMPLHLADFDVTLVIADEAPMPSEETGPRILLASEFSRYRTFFENAPKLYHFGNNPQHCYMLELIARDPGVVVLHDFNLGYLHEMATLRWGRRASYVRLMEREYGALGRNISAWHFQNGFRETFSCYELPLNGGVLECATAVITHSRQVQYKAAARVPRIPVWYIPHHLSPRAASFRGLSRSVARKRTGLPDDVLVVTALGFVTRAKQIPVTLDALARLRGKVPPFRFVLGGERRLDEYDVNADIARCGMQNLITCTDYLDEKQFFELLAATDIIVNLRYPSGGEMSGTLVRALGMGTPTVVLDYGPIGELPNNVVRKIRWNSEVRESLASALHDLMTDADARATLGASAAAFVRSNHDIKKIAQLYSRVLRQAGRATAIEQRLRHFAGPKYVARKFQELGLAASEAAGASAGMLWWGSAGVPIAGAGERALVVSDGPQQTAGLLSLLFGWEDRNITAMTTEEFLAPSLRDGDGTPMLRETFTFALAIAPSQMDERDAALLLRRLNASLQKEAPLVVEIWTPDSDLPEKTAFAEEKIVDRLNDAGFGAATLVSQREGLIRDFFRCANADGSGRRYVCATARKTSDYSVWRFLAQYDGLPIRSGGRVG